jgi:hypothetical protein
LVEVRRPELLSISKLSNMFVSFVLSTYWEHKRNSSSDRLAAIQLRSSAKPKPLLSIGLPARDCRAVEENFDGVAGR